MKENHYKTVKFSIFAPLKHQPPKVARFLPFSD